MYSRESRLVERDNAGYDEKRLGAVSRIFYWLDDVGHVTGKTIIW